MHKINQTKYRASNSLKWPFFRQGMIRNTMRLALNFQSIINYSYHKYLLTYISLIWLLKISETCQLCIIRWKCPDEQWAVFCRRAQSLRKFLGFGRVLPTDHSPSARGIPRFSSARLELSEIFTKSSISIVKCLCIQQTLIEINSNFNAVLSMRLLLGYETSVKQWCPVPLRATFTYIHNDGSTSTCGGGSSLSLCPDWSTMTFDYSLCSTEQAFSSVLLLVICL